MKKQLTWTDHFDRWALSGLSKKDYCARNGLSYQMFFYHQRRALEWDSSSGFQEVVVGEHVSEKFSSHESDVTTLHVQFSNGTVMFFPEHLLERVVELITRDGSC